MTKSEKLFQRWCKELDIYCHRFYDSKSMRGYAPQQPADFFVFHNQRLWFVEVKEFQSSNISYENLRQIPRLVKALKYDISSFFFMVTNKGVFIVKTELILYYIRQNGDKKSIPLDYIEDVGLECKNKSDLMGYL